MRLICFLSGTRIGRERAAEHWLTTLGLLLCGLVLDHVPMLDQNAIFDANDVRCNPVHREAEVRKSSVHDDEIPFTHNRSMLIFESWRKTLDEIKQALTTGSNVSRRLLDVLQIREALSGVSAPFDDGGNLGWRNLVADRGIAVLSARKVALQEGSASRLTLLRISKEDFQPQVLWW